MKCPCFLSSECWTFVVCDLSICSANVTSDPEGWKFDIWYLGIVNYISDLNVECMIPVTPECCEYDICDLSAGNMLCIIWVLSICQLQYMLPEWWVEIAVTWVLGGWNVSMTWAQDVSYLRPECWVYSDLPKCLEYAIFDLSVRCTLPLM